MAKEDPIKLAPKKVRFCTKLKIERVPKPMVEAKAVMMIRLIWREKSESDLGKKRLKIFLKEKIFSDFNLKEKPSFFAPKNWIKKWRKAPKITPKTTPKMPKNFERIKIPKRMPRL